MIFDLLIAAITSALLFFACVAILNVFTFPRLRQADSMPASIHSSASQSALPSNLPPVSICIPARNESAVIAATVRAWLEQDYPALEILLLDDHSDDGTAQIAQEAAQHDPRFRIISGATLPPGWKGKNWACHQLSQHAGGEILVFTDADVRWQPGALSTVVSHFRRSHADLLTIWPTQQTVTWGERLVVPLMALTIMAYLPILAVHYIPWAVFAAANGQCLIFNRAAYNKVGGHLAVKNNIVEDMGFAYQIKKQNMRLRMADGNGWIVTRMYRNWQEARDGFAKNILGGHGNRSFSWFSPLFFTGQCS
jgi:chlorobactene glucosyltransferase